MRPGFFFFSSPSLPTILNLSEWFCRGEQSVVWALRRWIKAAGTLAERSFHVVAVGPALLKNSFCVDWAP